MRRFGSLADIPSDWGRSVVTIGVFDGVHRGHRLIIDRARRLATQLGASVVAVTFDPHPSAVVRPDSQPMMLSTIDHRVSLLGAAGADAVLVLPFTKELSSWTPTEFVDRVLVEPLGTVGVVVGEGFRFGHRAAGDVAVLQELGTERGFTVDAVPLELAAVVEHGDSGHVAWSSTYVRQCVAEGDVAEAARALERPHRVEGVVVHGDHRGRELGYPTANLEVVEHAAIPGDGVYAGWLVRHPGTGVEEQLPAAISIGTNPTFEGVERRVEGYVLDRDDLDLYDERVAFDFVSQLRPTVKFDAIDALIEQIEEDVRWTREALALGPR
ncbi:MAG: bifunctional riboflavin kinase/FAD synthetase [Actinomycetes bacterium]